MPKQWTFSKGGKRASFKWWDQYIAGSGVQTEKGSIKNAEVVFVGYGIQAPEYGWDDFKGQDLKGKVLLMLNNDPDWDPNLFAGNTRLYYGRWTYKYESAARQGAAGAIIVHTTPSAGYGFQVVQNSWSGEQVETPAESEPRIQVKGWMTEDASRDLVKLAGQDLDKLVEAAKSKDFTAGAARHHHVARLQEQDQQVADRERLRRARRQRREAEGRVRDLQRASRSSRRRRAGCFGRQDLQRRDGQRFRRGAAARDGQGVQGAARRRRSARSCCCSSRRKSRACSARDTTRSIRPIAPAKIAANINYDGGNIWGRTKDIIFIGKGKSTIDEYVEAIAKLQERTVVPDQFPDRGFFYRSDQFSFAKIGVPALYLDAGTDFVGQPPEWGKQQHEDVREGALPRAVRRNSGQLELRRHDRRRAARLLRRPERRERGAGPDVGAGR